MGQTVSSRDIVSFMVAPFTVIVQFKTFIYIKRHPHDSRVESSYSPVKILKQAAGSCFLYFYLQRKRQFLL